MLWAHLVAVVHALAVVLMVTGALIALRRPRVLYLHAPVAAAILAVYLTGVPCPLTELELVLRERAGTEPYTGGFLGHYAVAPLGLDVGSPAVQAGIYTIALVPNLVGYGLLAARGRPTTGRARPTGPVRMSAPRSPRGEGLAEGGRRGRSREPHPVPGRPVQGHRLREETSSSLPP